MSNLLGIPRPVHLARSGHQLRWDFAFADGVFDIISGISPNFPVSHPDSHALPRPKHLTLILFGDEK